jgi:hypothetical protein
MVRSPPNGSNDSMTGTETIPGNRKKPFIGTTLLLSRNDRDNVSRTTLLNQNEKMIKKTIA